ENSEVVTSLPFYNGSPPSAARCFYLIASEATLRSATITAWYMDGRPIPRFGGGGISSRATSTSRSPRFRSVNVILFLWFLVPWFGRSQCKRMPGPPSTLLTRFLHLDCQLGRGRDLEHPLALLAGRLTNTCSLRQIRLMPARQLDPHRGVVLLKAKSRTLQPLHTLAQIVRGALDPGQTS